MPPDARAYCPDMDFPSTWWAVSTCLLPMPASSSAPANFDPEAVGTLCYDDRSQGAASQRLVRRTTKRLQGGQRIHTGRLVRSTRRCGGDLNFRYLGRDGKAGRRPRRPSGGIVGRTLVTVPLRERRQIAECRAQSRLVILCTYADRYILATYRDKRSVKGGFQCPHDSHRSPVCRVIAFEADRLLDSFVRDDFNEAPSISTVLSDVFPGVRGGFS